MSRSERISYKKRATKLFVAINGMMLEEWGEDPFPTHARIYHLLSELRKYGDIEIEYVKYNQVPRSNIISIIYNNIKKTQAAFESTIRIIKDRPIVYFEYPYSMTTVQNRFVFKICNLLKVKTILDVHDTVEQAEAISDGRSALSRGIEKDCLMNATLVSSLNASMWERLVITYKIPRNKKVVFVPNAFEDSFIRQYQEAYRSKNARFNICYIGGLSKNRGIEILVEACLDLHKKYPYLNLFLFGEIGVGITEELSNIIEKSDFIKRKVIPRKQLPDMLKDIDLFVMPYNPFIDYTNLSSPTKLFEYMATGRPILSTKCKSVRDLIEEGIIYMEYDLDDFKKNIELLIVNSELRERLAKGIASLRCDHTWKERAKSLHDAINSLQ